MKQTRRTQSAQRPRAQAIFDPLEGRVMLSKAVITPASYLTKADRQALLADWTGSDKAQLTADLKANNLTGFDNDLLSFMSTQTQGKFYFQSSQVPSYLSYINSNLSTTNITTQANDVVSHLFPSSSNATSYTTQLPAGNINWVGTGGTDFYLSLNRQAFWQPLAEAYRLTGESKYSTELTNELASWSSENPPLADANSWASHEPNWDLLSTSIRATNWTWTYALMIGTSGWSAQANTLFLYKMDQTGQFLRAATPVAINDNRAIEQYAGLIGIADLFPQFTGSADWLSYGHKELYRAMNAQIYPDGSDREQSPGYASAILSALLDIKQLDQDNGYSWSSTQNSQLSTALTAYEEMLSPNGDRAAIGDTYRESSDTLWLEADLVQGTTAFPAAKPRVADVWKFGPSVVSGYEGNPVNPPLPDRGLTYAEPDAGDYMFRSGSDADARQVIFEAGPKGGTHGHYDYLNFELSGYGHPLIADPGLVTYDSSADRTWAVSTPAHNTVSADGLNAGDLEGAGNPGIVVDQWDPESNFVQVTAHEDGYSYLAGSPQLSRSIWYDYDGTMLIMDWAVGTASHTYSVAFNLPGTATKNSDNSIQSTNGDGDVKITPLLTSGKTFAAANKFVSNTASPDESPAVHYTESAKGDFAAFATLVTTYTGSTPPDTTATVLNTPSATGTVTVALTKNGVTQDIVFTPPHQIIPDVSGTVAASNASIAYDSKGQLHMAYYNPTTGHLYYTVRGTNGVWSAVQLVDDAPDVGLNPSLAINSNGAPGIAYYDATNGDLKYAYLDPNYNSWQVQTVDSAGTTGEYPSLAFNRHLGPAISYFDATHHALKLAQPTATGWSIDTVDKSANVGRYSSLSLDPSRPTASKWAISYNDTTHGTIKYAVQYHTGWAISTVGSGAGVTSLAFDSSNEPAIAYYDRKDTAVEVARFNASSKTFSSTAVSSSSNGQDPNLAFTKQGVATVFFSSTSSHRVIRAVQNHSKWTETTLGTGGNSLDVARYSTSTAYTDGNVADNQISVLFV